MSRAMQTLPTVVVAVMLLFAGSAWAAPTICQPGRQTLPLPMGSNIGPNAIGGYGQCDWGTAGFKEKGGYSYFTAFHVAFDLFNGNLGASVPAQMVNPGIASFGGCSLRYPPQVNNVGYLCGSDYLKPSSTGLVNHEDAAETCAPSGSVQGPIIYIGDPSSYVPTVYPMGYPVDYYGATSCLVGGYFYQANQSVSLDMGDVSYAFSGMTEMLMDTQAGGDSGAMIVSGSSTCHMQFGMIAGQSPDRICPIFSMPGLCGYPTWVSPILYTLSYFNVSLGGANFCTVSGLWGSAGKGSIYGSAFVGTVYHASRCATQY